MNLTGAYALRYGSLGYRAGGLVRQCVQTPPFVSNRSLTCVCVSELEVQPISGSTSRADAGANSKTQPRVFAVPDDMAVFDGW